MSAAENKAVFLSYASQDAEAARRICEALRAAGVEVWLDQDGGLVGGDAWDAKIRDQIATCALFIAIISANTQARCEGYFRLEWKLAAQRTHMMSERTAFLLPVVIDDTRDAEGDVPAEFRAVQWTRLKGGVAGTQFVERVQALLGGGSGTREPSPPVVRAAGGTPVVPGKSPRRRLGFALPLVAVAIAMAIWLPSPRTSPTVPPNSKPHTPNSELSRLAADAKSIAVLPFKNQSEEKDSAFFTDGVHEDILTNLFNIRELRVVSRTSVEQYRGTTKTIKQIGAELGVAYILEGSVQRVGNQVRVTGQLIDARTDGHLWAKAFDEKLSDVFVIQASIAKAIASELKAVLSPEERHLVERRATANPAAYDLYLKAREMGRGGLGSLEERQALLQDAVKLDPSFARAWSSLALVRFHLATRLGRASTRIRDQFETAAREAVDAAVRLAPEAPETLLCLGDYYYRLCRDYPRALEYLERLRRLQPNDPDAHASIGYVQRAQGNWAESTVNLRKAAQLDPTNYPHVVNLAGSLKVGRRYDELIALFGRFTPKTSSGNLENYFSELGRDSGRRAEIAYVQFLATGSTHEMDEIRAAVPPAHLDTPQGITARKLWARLTGDFAEAIRLDRPQPSDREGDQTREIVDAALTLAAYGDRKGAQARLGNLPSELRARLAEEPDHRQHWAQLARAEIVLGNKEEAIRCARKAVELTSTAIDASVAPSYRQILASVYAWAGDKDQALAELGYVLRTPSYPPAPAISVHVARRSPEFFPLRGDPRFEALLDDPKNNQPLF